MKKTEKELDQALENAFRTNPEFVDWFVGKTKFATHGARYHASRSDHPWGKVQVEIKNPVTGLMELAQREGETDILVILETEPGVRVALHIENKISSGHFTKMQPEMYAARARAWQGDEKHGGYSDWDTVLVAPQSFQKKYPDGASQFGAFVSHEEIAMFVPAFG